MNSEVKNELKVKDIGQVATTKMLSQVIDFANLDSMPLTNVEKQYAVGIITNINKKISTPDKDGRRVEWQDLDVKGCQLPQQIKSYAKLGLQIELQEMFIDIRNNGKTGLKDINLKMQYQGVEKIITRYCTYGDKKVVRFYKDIICKGDKIVEKPNLLTGLYEIKSHDYYETDDVDYRNKYENIIGAYAIAYILEDGKLNPYIARIDKNRIERGKKAAMTQNIWNSDTRKMVIKTAVWELYNVLKPYMIMPQEVANDLDKIIKNEVNFDNKDFIEVEAEDVKKTVKESIASEKVDNDFNNDETNNSDEERTKKLKEEALNQLKESQKSDSYSPMKEFNMYD